MVQRRDQSTLKAKQRQLARAHMWRAAAVHAQGSCPPAPVPLKQRGSSCLFFPPTPPGGPGELPHLPSTDQASQAPHWNTSPLAAGCEQGRLHSAGLASCHKASGPQRPGRPKTCSQSLNPNRPRGCCFQSWCKRVVQPRNSKLRVEPSQAPFSVFSSSLELCAHAQAGDVFRDRSQNPIHLGLTG